MAKHTILLVDDNSLLREVARLHLSSAGFRLVCLDGPLHFAKRLREESPSVALIDVNMPGLKGNQITEIARRLVKDVHCPLILFSEIPEEELAELAKSCGADGYISKSTPWDRIVRTLTRLIEQHGQSEPPKSEPPK
jgi:two-component system chemotaxis response regulator CheY